MLQQIKMVLLVHSWQRPSYLTTLSRCHHCRLRMPFVVLVTALFVWHTGKQRSARRPLPSHTARCLMPASSSDPTFAATAAAEESCRCHCCVVVCAKSWWWHIDSGTDGRDWHGVRQESRRGNRGRRRHGRESHNTPPKKKRARQSPV